MWSLVHSKRSSSRDNITSPLNLRCEPCGRCTAMWSRCDTSRLSSSIVLKFTHASLWLPRRTTGIKFKLQSLQYMTLEQRKITCNYHLQLQNTVLVLTILISWDLPILSSHYKAKIFRVNQWICLSRGFFCGCWFDFGGYGREEGGRKRVWEEGKTVPLSVRER